ncbi:MAG: two-component system response regulator [Candidatus Omnitrophica bacterium 4484_70.1]|nr:MAG: two-component system response regulator [Candidatus Omnitrophica bacterium 4484_70.1]
MTKKVLIIEDAKHVVMMLESRLRANGYEVISAYDGQQGLERAQKEKPDLIIMDIMLPKLTGDEVCKKLKQNKELATIPIIVLTALARRQDIKLAEQLGVDAYITKPFMPDVLLSKIGELIGKNS